MCQFTVWQNRYMKIADDEGFRTLIMFLMIFILKDHLKRAQAKFIGGLFLRVLRSVMTL